MLDNTLLFLMPIGGLLLLLVCIGFIKQEKEISRQRDEHQRRLHEQELYNDYDDDGGEVEDDGQEEEEPWSEDLPYDRSAYHKNWRFDRRYSWRIGNFYYDIDWGWYDDMLGRRNDD